MLLHIYFLYTLFAPQAFAALRFAGVNLAGCEFGIDYLGTRTTTQLGYCDNANDVRFQINHFINKWQMNIFRIPVGWQFLVNDTLGGPLEPTYFNQVDAVMQVCIASGAYCILDVHNYGRWNGYVIGQSSDPHAANNAHFTSLWGQLAEKYVKNNKVMFGLMNEPHDLDLATWAATLQKAVTMIRSKGAKSQYILLPPSDYSEPQNLSTASGPFLDNIVDYDGSKIRLIFDLHQYYHPDNTLAETTPCYTNHIKDAIGPATTWLKSRGRQALLTETGGVNNGSCTSYVCQALDYLIDHNATWLGYAGWSAGSFDTNYGLTLTPFPNGTDQYMTLQCFGPRVKGH